MSKLTTLSIAGVCTQLQELRTAVEALRQLQLRDVHELRGHQTVDAAQSLALSFQKLSLSIDEMESTLGSIAEATANDGHT